MPDCGASGPSAEMAIFSIPSVDISPFLRDPESADAERVVGVIKAACETSGIFQITGHGIPVTLQEQVLAAAKAVFSLPEREKLKLNGGPGRGYEVYGNEVSEETQRPDIREVSLFGQGYSRHDPPPPWS